MFKHLVKIGNPRGIHLNPATKIVQFAMSRPELKIKLKKGDVEVDAASVMSILSLELRKDTEVIVVMEKEDKEALNFIDKVLEGQ